MHGKTRSANAPAITRPDKLLFPADGIRKGRLADYYALAMDWLLPEIADRPLSVVRCPEGIGGECFYQKHPSPGLERVARVEIAERSGERAQYLCVADAAGVMELVQFNAIEFHPWGAKADDLEHADRLVFDFDPDPAVAWAGVIQAARRMRASLADAGLQSFVRTTGGKGLHVVAPLAPAAPWERVHAFARAMAESLAAAEPGRYVATAARAGRKGRIFIDWLRNTRGATSVASFSVRARPGAPVAMPLRWAELGRVASGHAYHLCNAPARLRRLRSHPWGDYAGLRQGLPERVPRG
jgi:bifunctional non-homologous end joining protein LigD